MTSLKRKNLKNDNPEKVNYKKEQNRQGKY